MTQIAITMGEKLIEKEETGIWTESNDINEFLWAQLDNQTNAVQIARFVQLRVCTRESFFSA